MLILKKDDIKKCFTMRDAIEADKEALEIYSEGKAKVPLRTNIDIDEKNGQNLYMPAYVGGNQAAAGLKSFLFILIIFLRVYQVCQRQ